jgi:hypothetical protein
MIPWIDFESWIEANKNKYLSKLLTEKSKNLLCEKGLGNSISEIEWVADLMEYEDGSKSLR